MEYFKLTIVADHNDGDYVTGISKISAEDLEEFILHCRPINIRSKYESY